MTYQHEKEVLTLIRSLQWGEITIKKEAGEVVVIKKTESIKLSGIEKS